MEFKKILFLSLLVIVISVSGCSDSKKNAELNLDAIGPKGCSIKKLNDCSEGEFKRCNLEFSETSCGKNDSSKNNLLKNDSSKFDIKK